MAEPRILIIDDSENIRKSLRLTLEFRGWNVDEAADGAEGLKRIEERRFDLVFVDLVMPGLSGVEWIRKIRGDLHMEHLPIIILSAEQRESKKEALAAGANAGVDKPFSPAQIFTVVEQHLARGSDEAP